MSSIMKLLRRPPGYIVAVLISAMGGFLFGIDTGIIGPVTVMDEFTKYTGHPSPTLHGLIVSSILIPAALSSIFAGKLADTMGRSRAIGIGSLIFALGATIEGAAVHIGMFVAGRVIEGIGEGLYLGTIVVYICEISRPQYRGALTTAPQLLTTLGLVAGFFTCYGTDRIPSSFSWRLPFLLLAGYAYAFSAVTFLYLPPSPRWLTLHGREAEATEAWEKLGVPAADREKIMDQLETAVRENVVEATGTVHPIQVEEPVRRRGSKKAKFLEVLAPDARPRFFLAIFLMGMQQLSGIDGVLYYAPLLFQQAGLSSAKSTFLASGVSAILMFGVTIPATLYADRWSRRANTILGGLGLALTMFLIGSLYASDSVHATSGAGRWVVMICIYLFAVIYCVSWAVGMKVYAAEIQPTRTRATATSMAHGSNWLTNFLVALVTPTLLANSSYGAYFLFGGCTFLTAVFCLVFMPETRGRSLDEIEAAFYGSPLKGLKELRNTVRRRLMGRMSSGVTVHPA